MTHCSPDAAKEISNVKIPMSEQGQDVSLAAPLVNGV